MNNHPRHNNRCPSLDLYGEELREAIDRTDRHAEGLVRVWAYRWAQVVLTAFGLWYWAVLA